MADHFWMVDIKTSNLDRLCRLWPTEEEARQDAATYMIHHGAVKVEVSRGIKGLSTSIPSEIWRRLNGTAR